MKYLLASDIHGSMVGFNRLKQRIVKENPHKTILLGDIFYHGIRNNLPSEYNPALLLKELNSIKGEMFSVIGNCDSEVDVSVAEFAFLPYFVLNIGEKSVFLSHGHRYNKATPPPVKFDACIYGHEHIGYFFRHNESILQENSTLQENNPLFACVGSVSMSKGGPECYLVLEDSTLTLKDMDGNVLEQATL